MPDPNAAPRAQEVEEIYRALTRGLGHERVNDDNVFALIRRADEDGREVLAQELREWQSPCNPDAPSTIASTPASGSGTRKY